MKIIRWVLGIPLVSYSIWVSLLIAREAGIAIGNAIS